MKKLFTLAIALVFSTGIAFAQNNTATSINPEVIAALLSINRVAITYGID